MARIKLFEKREALKVRRKGRHAKNVKRRDRKQTFFTIGQGHCRG